MRRSEVLQNPLPHCPLHVRTHTHSLSEGTPVPLPAAAPQCDPYWAQLEQTEWGKCRPQGWCRSQCQVPLVSWWPWSGRLWGEEELLKEPCRPHLAITQFQLCSGQDTLTEDPKGCTTVNYNSKNVGLKDTKWCLDIQGRRSDSPLSKPFQHWTEVKNMPTGGHWEMWMNELNIRDNRQ